ncbi:Kelch repeat-containing protein [Spirosoma foliorum]|uniref:Galactose oxidase n=1 Tax=Spirosoma foliorum TaxID=2710596 RepID=A0A7G5H266_9BACT|nr:kelch repeat-containing protein [Spirosoma foliorum]QMW05208.1 galactose oxidase [Spirosoma foliorum]
MIHLPFRFLSATNSQSKAISTETTLSNATKKTKRVNWTLALVGIGWAGLLIGCNNSSTVDTLGDWNSRSELEGPARFGAASFVVGTIAYMGTGTDVSNNRLKDMWAYDASRNAWTQKADFPGVARNLGVGFSVGTKGYIGTGLDANSTRLKDFWEYDPTANSWKQVADFGGTARQTATAFAIGTKGYVTCGFDGNYLKDMWSYTPTTNTWTKVASYGGSKRVGAVAFVINNMAYVGTGNNNNSNQLDWYVYDPAQDLWTQKLNFITDQTSIARSYAVGFAINGLGYITGGDATTKDVWEYNPTADTWTTRGVFEGSSRTYAVAWSINNKGYITTGANGTSRFDDLWDFDPTVVQVIP